MKTYLKKNRALLILPLALLPFVVLIFYILGGGEQAGQDRESTPKNHQTQGVNYELPGADRSIEIDDKMEAYQKQASRMIIRDYDIMGVPDSVHARDSLIAYPGDSLAYLKTNEKGLMNPDVPNKLLEHIKQKEAQIQQEITGGGKSNQTIKTKYFGNQKTAVLKTKPRQNRELTGQITTTQLPRLSTGIDELDQLFDENRSLSRQNDSLSFYLCQAQQKLQKLETTKIFELENNRSLGFNTGESLNTLIKAEIYETGTVLDGHRVKLRLLEDCLLKSVKIHKNTFFYGICKLNRERLQIQVSQLPTGGSFLPVKITIHDLDGLPGLYVPGQAARKIAKEVGSSTNTSSLFGTTSKPLTYIGISAADRTSQSLLKMVRLKKVTVRKNTLVYLINQK